MSTTLDLTVGDNAVRISGTIAQKQLGALADLTGCVVKFSLIDVNTGATLINEAVATLGAFDPANNAVAVYYQLQPADVAAAVALAKVRWTFIFADGTSKIHAPSSPDEQTFIRINA